MSGMVDGDHMSASIVFLRGAVWGQALGILAFATFLAVEDAPDYFARTSPWAIALPLAAIVGVQLPGASDFLARSLSSGMLVLLVLITSVSTAAAAIAYMVQAYAIPGSLVTEGWRYTRTTSTVLSGVFLLALGVNLVMSIRLFRSNSIQS